MLKREFDQLAASIGSTYAAVNYVAKSARDKIAHTDGHVLESEAISWVLTGEEPKVRNKTEEIERWYLQNYIDDMLSEVDDIDVAQAVRDSYAASMEQHHLIYSYPEHLDENRKSRVRILTRMIWYYIKNEGGYINGE